MKTQKWKRLAARKSWLSVFRGTRGQTIVEFSLAIPIFLLLSLALLYGGRAYFVNQVILNPAREGARMGTMGDFPPTSVVAVIRRS